jgi:hypothetical protein
MTNPRKIAVVITCITVATWWLAACTGIKLYGPCDIPKRLSKSDLIGEWQLNYSDFLTELTKEVLNGNESIVLDEDGIYVHSFTSNGYAYHDQGNRWELVLDAPDSPKVKMKNMKYFAFGIEQAETQGSFALSAQMADRFRIQDYDKDKSGAQWVSKGVTYPTDGYIYLYPRLCDGELALVQMMHPRQDTDDMSVQYPVFTRK